MRTFFILVLLAALAVGGWLAWAIYLPVTPQRQTFVLLHSGYSTRRIARELKSAGIIRDTHAFILWHHLRRHDSLKAGEYLFEKPADMRAVFDRLARGDIYVHTVVIPEGYTMFDIAQAIEDAGLGTREDFLKVATSETTLIADFAPDAKSLEGYLFPNTYQFTRTQSLPEMAAAMVKQFRTVAQELGLTINVPQTVTMASIVEKETAALEERSVVASVYNNRLARNIALQADPSVIYAELLDGTYTGALHHDDLRVASDYNTYLHTGMPPGPIANPGRTSLEAAMHPATTSYYYFVSDGNGHHRFATNLEEHNRNVNSYRRSISRTGYR